MKKFRALWHLALFVIIAGLHGQSARAQNLTNVGFGKFIDIQDWSSKMRMSFDQILASVQSEIAIYRFDLKYMEPVNSSIQLQSLPYLSKPLLKAYSQSLVMARSRAMYAAETELDNPIKKPLILLRQDSEHWTLIHEYTHHLFHQARKIKNQSLPENYRELYVALTEALIEEKTQFSKNGNSFKTTSEIDRVAKLIKNTTNLVLNLQINFTLEEIVIENMIRQYYLQNPLEQRKMNLALYANSLSYVDSKLNEVIDNLLYLKTTISLFVRGMQPYSVQEQVLKQSLLHVLNLEEQIKKYKIVKLKTSEDL